MNKTETSLLKALQDPFDYVQLLFPNKIDQAGFLRLHPALVSQTRLLSGHLDRDYLNSKDAMLSGVYVDLLEGSRYTIMGLNREGMLLCRVEQQVYPGGPNAYVLLDYREFSYRRLENVNKRIMELVAQWSQNNHTAVLAQRLQVIQDRQLTKLDVAEQE